MKKIETIIIKDVYDVEEAKKLLPFYAETCCDVFVRKYGYLHDVGTEIALTPCEDGEPKGWDTFETDLEKAIELVQWCWDTNAEYGYH